jgi:hypothetical protein
MKRSTLIMVAAAALYTSAAHAAAPVFNWTGFYLGANGGYGWGSRDIFATEVIYRADLAVRRLATIGSETIGFSALNSMPRVEASMENHAKSSRPISAPVARSRFTRGSVWTFSPRSVGASVMLGTGFISMRPLAVL